LGIVTGQISPPLYVFNNGSGINSTPGISLEGGTTIPLKQNGIYQTIMDIRPAFRFTAHGASQYLNYGAQLRRLNLYLGAWVRQNLLFNYDSFIFSFGILQPTYNFVYSYDLRAPWNMHFFGNSGAHEVTFSVQFQYNEKRNKFRTINCPEI
jgi:hypothetical protein